MVIGYYKMVTFHLEAGKHILLFRYITQLENGKKTMYISRVTITITWNVVCHWLYLNVVGKLWKGNNIWLRHNIFG